MTYKIGVIGDKASVLPFRLFGFQVCYAYEAQEVKQAFAGLLAQSAIIYLTETCAEMIPNELAKVQHEMTPAIILIPDYDGSRGIGRRMIQENVEKAVGQNIL
jgi:V/A-type H+/Na+-transporting ATPase subunit F